MALKTLNHFEKAYIAQQNSFFTTCEMAARALARYLSEQVTPPGDYAGYSWENIQAYSISILKNGVGDAREFAKQFLQYHTGEIETNTFGEGNTINVSLLAESWAINNVFDSFMHNVFKLNA